jgi:hypothetical protein
MQPTEEFLRHATECEQMARSTRDAQTSAMWRGMAERWRRCAEEFTRTRRERMRRRKPALADI